MQKLTLWEIIEEVPLKKIAISAKRKYENPQWEKTKTFESREMFVRYLSKVAKFFMHDILLSEDRNVRLASTDDDYGVPSDFLSEENTTSVFARVDAPLDRSNYLTSIFQRRRQKRMYEWRKANPLPEPTKDELRKAWLLSSYHRIRAAHPLSTP